LGYLTPLSSLSPQDIKSVSVGMALRDLLHLLGCALRRAGDQRQRDTPLCHL